MFFFYLIISPLYPIFGFLWFILRILKTMTHQEMVKELSQRLGKTQKETRQLVDTTIKILTATFDEGKGISIPGLGTFQPHTTNPRKMFNPTDEKNYLIPKKCALRFSCSSSLKSSLPVNPVLK